jgi:hypothetical protein
MLIDAAVPRSVSLNAGIYVDDLQMDAAAASDDAVLEAMDDIAAVFLGVLQDDMHADLAYNKAVLDAASTTERKSEALAKRARIPLGAAVGIDVCVANNLGIDFAAGRKRGRWVRSNKTLKSQRMVKAKRRTKRAAKLRADMPSRKCQAKRLYTDNVRAVAYYGSEVHGLDEQGAPPCVEAGRQVPVTVCARAVARRTGASKWGHARHATICPGAAVGVRGLEGRL